MAGNGNGNEKYLLTSVKMIRRLLKQSYPWEEEEDFWIPKKARVVSDEDENEDESESEMKSETETEEEDEQIKEEEDQEESENENEETSASEEDEETEYKYDPEEEENLDTVGQSDIGDSNLPKYYMDKIEHFTEEQTEVFKYVCKLLQDKTFRRRNKSAIFVNGPTGSGKTALLKTLGEYVEKSLHRKVIFTASSAVAAVKYPSGKTAHSTFRFPFNIASFGQTQQEEWEINPAYVAENIAEASLIIYDDVNMTDKRLIHLLDYGLKTLMGNNKIFGGKIILFAGDFLQVAPISDDSQSPKFSNLWSKLKSFSVTKAHRTKSDADYLDFLIKMGSDNLPTYKIKIPFDLATLSDSIKNALPLNNIQCTDKSEDIIDFVFDKNVLSNPDLCAKRAILSPHAFTASYFNDKIVERLRGKHVKYVSVDTPDVIDMSFDNNKEDKTFPPRALELKKGCVCMIIRNIYEPIPLRNGTKVIVEGMSSDEILVRKPRKTEVYRIRRECFSIYSRGRQMERCQFPLSLAYAMTIYKSQGQTLDKAAVDLREPPFRHGQLYMALGRVRNRKDIKVLTHKSHIIKNVAHVPHFVNEELVQD